MFIQVLVKSMEEAILFNSMYILPSFLNTTISDLKSYHQRGCFYRYMILCKCLITFVEEINKVLQCESLTNNKRSRGPIAHLSNSYLNSDQISITVSKYLDN